MTTGVLCIVFLSPSFIVLKYINRSGTKIISGKITFINVGMKSSVNIPT